MVAEGFPGMHVVIRVQRERLRSDKPDLSFRVTTTRNEPLSSMLSLEKALEFVDAYGYDLVECITSLSIFPEPPVRQQ